MCQSLPEAKSDVLAVKVKQRTEGYSKLVNCKGHVTIHVLLVALVITCHLILYMKYFNYFVENVVNIK